LADGVVEAVVIDAAIDPDEPENPFNLQQAFLAHLVQDPGFVELLIDDPTAVVTAAGLTGPDVEAVVANLRQLGDFGGDPARNRHLAAAAFALLAATRFPVAGSIKREERE